MHPSTRRIRGKISKRYWRVLRSKDNARNSRGIKGDESYDEELKHMARKVGRSVAAWYGSGAPVEWTLTSPLSLGVGPTAGRMMRFHRKRLRKPLP